MRKPKGKTVALSAVAKDVIAIRVDSGDKLCDLVEKFYGVMRKHGIKQGDPCGNATRMNTWEWTGAWSLFLRKLLGELEMIYMFNETPRDLRCYERTRKRKGKR